MPDMLLASVANWGWASRVQKARNVVDSIVLPALKLPSLPLSRPQVWGFAIALSANLLGCSFSPKPDPLDIDLYQQWQLQPGDTIAGRTVTGGLGDISIDVGGKAVYAPFDGKTQPTRANCTVFSSPQVPGYLFRLCGLQRPKFGEVSQGEVIGRARHLEFAALRKQPDNRWAIVEPARSILERTLKQP